MALYKFRIIIIIIMCRHIVGSKMQCNNVLTHNLVSDVILFLCWIGGSSIVNMLRHNYSDSLWCNVYNVTLCAEFKGNSQREMRLN